jgi:hypothetical protein
MHTIIFLAGTAVWLRRRGTVAEPAVLCLGLFVSHEIILGRWAITLRCQCLPRPAVFGQVPFPGRHVQAGTGISLAAGLVRP